MSPAATGAAPDGDPAQLESHAPRADRRPAHGAIFGELDDDAPTAVDAFARVIHDKIVSVCRLAVERLEPAARRLGAGGRRPRREPPGAHAGRRNGGSILGWNPDELVDNQVTTLQARRPDESAIATLVGYGCHPVTTGYDMFIYSADFPGPLRGVVRAVDRRRMHLLPGRGRQRPPAVRVHRRRGRGRADGNAARASRRSTSSPTGSRAGRARRGSTRAPSPRSRGTAASARRGRSRRSRRSARRSRSRSCRTRRSRRSRSSARSTTRRSRRGSGDGRPWAGQGRLLPREVGAEDRVAATRRHARRRRCTGRCTRSGSVTASS